MTTLALKLKADTRLYISLASKPGNFGNKFHNYLFDHFRVNALYKSMSTHDFSLAVSAIRALDIAGSAVSMPFKETALPLLDELDGAARAIGAVNTIVNSAGTLKGYNTDAYAVELLLDKISPQDSVLIIGAGGMANAACYALRKKGFGHVVIYNRNTAKARQLAGKYGFSFSPEPVYHTRVVMNATPVGMCEQDLPVLDLTLCSSLYSYWDFIVKEKTVTALTAAPDINHVSGQTVAMLQARRQFELYTGIAVDNEVAAKAFSYATGPESVNK
ncbi:shikimate 5-dehydrogenase [Thalassomonas viridans]|uniref:shikimate dehydrogenase (NADP(+)) n=1 Tax=Thalassomonas viridans TaxID=137584 RepID=A0AAE9ZC21_9GAMM|nr:hypothetical protein [Thalassomonas viridans]WDE09229.1 shikimate 5-dehydrogenase [Thalassomonas viridans]